MTRAFLKIIQKEAWKQQLTSDDQHDKMTAAVLVASYALHEGLIEDDERRADVQALLADQTTRRLTHNEIDHLAAMATRLVDVVVDHIYRNDQ